MQLACYACSAPFVTCWACHLKQLFGLPDCLSCLRTALAVACRFPTLPPRGRMEFEPEDAVRVLPLCRHYFHPDCVAQWLSINKARV